MIYLISYKYKRKIKRPKDLVYCLFDFLTRKITKGKYSHSEIAISDKDGYFFCYSSSTRDKGVRVKRMKLDRERWDKIQLNIDKNQALKYFDKVKNNKYDYWGALGVILFAPQNRKKLFCSEFCYNAIFNSKDGWRFSPNQLHAICNSINNKE